MITHSFLPGRQVLARFLLGAIACFGLAEIKLAAQAIGPDFTGAYTIRDLGVFPNELSPWGINIKPGTTNVLLFRRDGNFSPNEIGQITLNRDATGHFSGYSGSPSFYSLAPGLGTGFGGIDGSLAIAPGNVILYTSFNDGTLGEIKAGSTNVDRQINLSDLGYTTGGSLAIVPAGFPGAGRLKILGLPWYDTTLTGDGNGTFNVASPGIVIPITNYLSGAIYVRSGTPRFTIDSVLVAEDADTTVAAYQIDANGDPVLATKRSFITGQSANFNGAVYDPVSKDFLFMGFNRHLYAVGAAKVTPPTVTLTSPIAGSQYPSNSAATLTAQASQPNGSISKVMFYEGTTLVDTVFQAPFSTTVGPLQVGNYSYFAVAFDGSGLSATSAVVSISVTNIPSNIPPVVSWANPTNNVTLAACSAIILKANATDPDRIGLPVEKIELFVNGSKMADFDRESKAFAWTDLAIGTYTLTFVATDVDGGSTTSKPIIVSVTQPPTNTLGVKFSSPANPRFPVVCLGGFLGRSYVLEASTNFVKWTAVTNIASTNLVTEYVDLQSTNFPTRYFRARLVP